MSEGSGLLVGQGRLVDNITHFARALRKAGLSVGSGRVIDAIIAVEKVGIARRDDFFWMLHACFVSRPEHRAVFTQIFRLFWRDRRFLEPVTGLTAPVVGGVDPPMDAQRRAAEALLDGSRVGDVVVVAEDRLFELDATQSFSARDVQRHADFEQMSVAERIAAAKSIARIELLVRPMPSRRSRRADAGNLPDWRGTMRQALRNGGEIQTLRFRKLREKQPNLVALCDISGSMATYSRMFLHFLHAATNQNTAHWTKVHSFTFGTRLTNVTRHLAQRDVDAALRAAGREAQDWEGGTRIGACLHQFNRDWSRRVLGQGAVVLLITDGLDRDDANMLAIEAERLHLSCRKLIWLNPLLRWDGFAPKARGIRALLPHVDSFRSVHNLASLEELAVALNQADDGGEKQRLLALMGQE